MLSSTITSPPHSIRTPFRRGRRDIVGSFRASRYQCTCACLVLYKTYGNWTFSFHHITYTIQHPSSPLNTHTHTQTCHATHHQPSTLTPKPHWVRRQSLESNRRYTNTVTRLYVHAKSFQVFFSQNLCIIKNSSKLVGIRRRQTRHIFSAAAAHSKIFHGGGTCEWRHWGALGGSPHAEYSLRGRRRDVAHLVII